MNIVCKIRGHHWVTVWASHQLCKGAPAVVCTRCRENGWVLR